MGWRIREQFIDNPESVGEGEGADPKELPQLFPLWVFLFDDDGILYYIVEATSQEWAERAHDWTQADSGTTNSYIDVGDGLEAFM